MLIMEIILGTLLLLGIKGRKQGGHSFMVANPKTANILYDKFKKKLRKEKLNKLNDIQLGN